MVNDEIIDYVKDNNIEKVKEFVAVGLDVRMINKSLTIASLFGHIELVRLMLEHGADVNTLDFNDDTPLSFATMYGYVDVVRLLLEYNPDINKNRSLLVDPLRYSCYHRHVEIVKLLVDHGAKFNVR